MKKEIRKKILTLGTFFLLIVISQLLPIEVFAVDVFLFSAKREISSDDLIVSLGLDTGEDKINAVSGEISYDQNILELVSISNANSIIPLWVESPSNKNSDSVSFSGIVPGGFGGQGKIISLIFKSKKEVSDVVKAVQINNIEILRNDGSGTIIPTKIIMPSLELANSLDIASVGDTDAPELFKPILSKNDPLLGGQSYLIFNTTDKGSGIDKYFVIESSTKLKSKDDALWVEAMSPYLLQDQTLSSYVYVKVVDRAGNSLVVELEKEKKFYQIWWFWVIITVALTSVILWWKRKRKFL